MDFNTLSRRQLQSLCKKNEIPANITNVAMSDALNALEFVEGVEEILNTSESEIAQSPMVPPTAGRTGTAKGVGMFKTPRAASITATRRRAAGSTSVCRKIEDSLDVKRDVSLKTPASRRNVVYETSSVNHGYNTRRSARLAEKNSVLKERPEVIKMNSFTEEMNENVEAVVDNLKDCSLKSNNESNAISEGNSDIIYGVDVEVASIEQTVASDFKNMTDQEEGGQDNGLMIETEGLVEDFKMYPNEAEETVTFIEDTVKNSDGDEEVDAFFAEDYMTSVDTNAEDTGMNSNVVKETEALIKKDAPKNINEDGKVKSSFVEDDETNAPTEATDMNSKVDGESKIIIGVKVGEENMGFTEDTEMNSNADEETKVSSEVTKMNFNVDDETKAPIAATGMIFEMNQESKMSTVEDTDMNSKEDEEIIVAGSRGDIVANVTVNMLMQDTDMPDDGVLLTGFNPDDVTIPVDVLVPEVEIQDELLNSEGKHEPNFSAIGYAAEASTDVPHPFHIAPLSKTPLKKSGNGTPKTVSRLAEVSDDKENVDMIRKLKKKLKETDMIIMELSKNFEGKAQISQQKMTDEEGKEDETMVKATPTRLALKILSDNPMAPETQN